jgi:very-short-patch-repair endonuclease
MKNEQLQAKNTQRFLHNAKVKYGDRYDYSLVEYNGSGNKVKIICSEHGIFEQQPANHLSSKEGCYQCGKNRAGKNHRMSQETFEERANNIHNNFYNYEKTTYVGAFLHVTITCPIHGDFIIQPNDHLFHECGCKQCGYENRLTKGEKKIADFLTESDIEFTAQHTFDDLKALDNINPLRYDFYLPQEGVLIEFDGPHHDQPTRYAGTSTDAAIHTHKRTVIYDKMKNEYAKKKGIRMIRIPYNQMKDIGSILSVELINN